VKNVGNVFELLLETSIGYAFRALMKQKEANAVTI